MLFDQITGITFSLYNLLQITSALQAEVLWNMGFTGVLAAA